MKNGKVAGEDEIVNEVWKYGGEGIKKVVEEVYNTIWSGAGCGRPKL